MYFIYRLDITNFGFNDGDEITNEVTLLLDYASTYKKAMIIEEKWQYEFYKDLGYYKTVNEKEKSIILKTLGKGANEYNWEGLLKNISFEDFKSLQSQLKFNFLKIIDSNPRNNKYYPLIKHSKFKEFEIDTKYYHDLEDLALLLYSKNKREAFEKGILFLLLTKDISQFIGDPETTEEEADFIDIYYSSRKKMLDYFTKPKFSFIKQKIDSDLISKHNILKFWILENPYRIDRNKFENFLEYKNDLLKDKIEHFDKIVELFSRKGSELIEVIKIP